MCELDDGKLATVIIEGHSLTFTSHFYHLLYRCCCWEITLLYHSLGRRRQREGRPSVTCNPPVGITTERLACGIKNGIGSSLFILGWRSGRNLNNKLTCMDLMWDLIPSSFGPAIASSKVKDTETETLYCLERVAVLP